MNRSRCIRGGKSKTTTYQRRFKKKEDENLFLTFGEKYRKTFPELKIAANQSGNSVVWRVGEPLDDLNQSLRDRIERALKFGI